MPGSTPQSAKYIAEALTDLQIDRFSRLSYFRNTKAAHRQWTEQNLVRHNHALENGVVETLYHGKKLIGYLAIAEREQLGPPGHVGTNIYHGYSGHSPRALSWIKSRLGANQDHLKGRYVSTNVSPTRMELTHYFLDQGFYINSLILMGKVDTALSRLIRRYDPPVDLSFWGLRIDTLTHKPDIDRILELKRREFSRNPQFGFFAAHKSYLDWNLRYLESEIEKPTLDHGNFLIKDRSGQRLLGFFAFRSSKNPYWGKSAGVELTFHHSIQGKGIAKVAYRMMLSAMKKRRINTFGGGTSQPPVLKLAKVMDRRVVGYHMYKGRGYFPAQHFLAY